MRRFRERLTYANVVATIALFGVVAGGVAVAGPFVAKNSVNSKSVKDETLTGDDIKNDSLTGDDVLESSLDISGKQGPPGPQGQTGGQGPTGAAGTARAYGRVGASGTITRSKGVVGNATNPQPGYYCIEIDSSIDVPSTVMVVNPEYSTSSTSPSNTFEKFALAEWDQVAQFCPGTQTMSVRTLMYDGDQTDNNDDTGDSPGDDLILQNEPFSFVVP